MSELEQYIQSFFGVIPANDLAKVKSYFRLETMQKGDFYLKKGRPCGKMSFIKSGLMRIYAETEQKEVTQWISTQGYFVTDLSSFVFQTPARWNIQALTDIEIYTISKEDYRTIHQTIPKWAEVENLFLAKCFTILEERVFNFISMSAEERYQSFFLQNSELFNQIPLQYIASMLGMTPETFSRIRKKQLS